MLSGDKDYIFYFFRENYDRGTNYQSLCLRPLSLLKPSDYIVLSDDPSTRSSFASSKYLYPNQVSDDQIIWVPLSLCDHLHVHETVIEYLRMEIKFDISTYHLVPYIVTKRLQAVTSKHDINILGDSLERVPSKDANLSITFSSQKLKTPAMFLVEDLNNIMNTYEHAVKASNIPVFLLKCAHTQGGAGIFKISTKKDLVEALKSEELRRLKDSINGLDVGLYGSFSHFKLYFEEFIDNNLATIVVTCCGDKVLCVTEQIQEGYTHIGNSYPLSSKLNICNTFLQTEVLMMSKKFQLTGPWGMDLVVVNDPGNGPLFYLVDINCGRFNGSHYPYITFRQYCHDHSTNYSCWMSRKIYFKKSFDSMVCAEDEIRDKNINATIVPMQLALYPGASRVMVCGTSKEEIGKAWEQLKFFEERSGCTTK